MDEFPQLVNPHDNSTIPINNSSFSIGRSLSCDHIIESLGVSRFHCILKKNDDKWTLFDRSTNGTRVNSTLFKFNESVDLKHGDVIRLGPEKLDFVFTSQREDSNETRDSLIENKKSEAETSKASMFPNDEELLEEAVSLLAESLEVPSQSTQPTPHNSNTNIEPQKESEDKKNETSDKNLDIMENELTCSICSELFIKAVTLNCSHTYCKFCIEEWKKTKTTCPICRKHIITVAPTLVLDNFIEKIISTQKEETKEMRKEIIRQREEIVGNTAGSSNTSVVPVVEILSDNDDEDEDSDDNDFSDYDNYDDYDCDYDYDADYDSSRSGYYGGYGRCYSCNQPGHWANTCPYRRR